MPNPAPDFGFLSKALEVLYLALIAAMGWIFSHTIRRISKLERQAEEKFMTKEQFKEFMDVYREQRGDIREDITEIKQLVKDITENLSEVKSIATHIRNSTGPQTYRGPNR